MPVKIYALFAAAALLALSLFFIPQEDCTVFYGKEAERLGSVQISGCPRLVWPQYILDKIK